jgi:chemotaxis protein methyltransferase CheR
MGLTAQDGELFIREVSKVTGMNWQYYRDAYILRRIEYRMDRCGIEDPSEYLAFLRENYTECKLLIDDIGINVTEFFRDIDFYQLLNSDILPAIIERKQAASGNHIRVWSTCCATGEEPYSLAMIFKEILPGDTALRVTIHATDIDEVALQTAHAGIYSLRKLATVSDHLREKYFQKAADGSDRYAISKDLKEMVRFKRMDLISGAPLAMMDLVLCRNMLIYIKRSLQPMLFKKLYESLVPGGYLALGKTETIPEEFADRLTVVHQSARIYGKGRYE